MKKKTVIYAGGFNLPDKSASANRVVANGKLFGIHGYRTVFLGRADQTEAFEGIRPVPACENMFEEAYPQSIFAWAKSLVSVKNIKTLAKKYDAGLIILYNLPLVTLLAARLAFGGSGIKVAYDCTEWSKDTDGSLPKRLFKAADEFFVRKFAAAFSQGIIVISSLMEKGYGKKKALLRLPPLVDINDAIWHQQPAEHEGFEFCFAGGMDANKESLDKIVQAFLLVGAPQARLKIVGVTEEQFRAFYPEKTFGSLSEKGIRFVGRLSHADTVRCVLGCDCYIFIRQSDRRNNAGFPTKFAEAYTCAVPIITTDVSDVGSYMKSNDGCLLKGTSTEEISRAMTEMLKKETNRQPVRPDSTFHYESCTQSCGKWLEQISGEDYA